MQLTARQRLSTCCMRLCEVSVDMQTEYRFLWCCNSCAVLYRELCIANLTSRPVLSCCFPRTRRPADNLACHFTMPDAVSVNQYISVRTRKRTLPSWHFVAQDALRVHRVSASVRYRAEGVVMIFQISVYPIEYSVDRCGRVRLGDCRCSCIGVGRVGPLNRPV